MITKREKRGVNLIEKKMKLDWTLAEKEGKSPLHDSGHGCKKGMRKVGWATVVEKQITGITEGNRMVGYKTWRGQLASMLSWIVKTGSTNVSVYRVSNYLACKHLVKIQKVIKLCVHLSLNSFRYSSVCVCVYIYIYIYITSNENKIIMSVSFVYVNLKKCVLFVHYCQIEVMTKMFLVHCSFYVWEIMHSTVKKMNKQVQKLQKEVDEARDRREAAHRRVNRARTIKLL